MNAHVYSNTSEASVSDSERTVPGKWPLYVRIMIGLVIGLSLGLVANLAVSGKVADPAKIDEFNWFSPAGLAFVSQEIADPLGRIFLRLIMMMVLPLVLSALVLGVYEIGDLRRLGRVGLRTLAFTAIFSFAAVFIGLLLVNTLKPGNALSEEKRKTLQEQYQAKAAATTANADKGKSLSKTLLDIIPENPLQEMVGAVDGSSKGNGMLAVMFFALVVGIAATRRPEACKTFVQTLEGVNAVCMEVIEFAMRLAPYAVACLMFSISAQLGLEILLPMLGFAGTVILGLLLQSLIVYPITLWMFASISPWDFYRGIREAMLTAFATSSSSATLPTALMVAEDRLHLPRDVSRFVLTVGATGNQNGTALYEGVVVLFMAQVFHVELNLMQQITVVMMSVLAGIGTAGVPGGSLPLIVVVMRSVDIPGEGIGIILGIDRILDMARTVLNVSGDLAIAACVSHDPHQVTTPPTPEGKDFADE